MPNGTCHYYMFSVGKVCNIHHSLLWFLSLEKCYLASFIPVVS